MTGSSLQAMEKTAAVHVGLHKTGTTAFQEALDLAAGELLDLDVQVMQYFGPLYRDTPVSQAFDLANAVVRLDIDAYFRLRAPESLLASVLEESERSVRAYAAAESRHLVASMESLSLISSTAEVERLVELLAPRKVTVVLVLREREAFLKSLRLQVERLGLPTASEFHDSCLYLEDDTWLADFERMVATFVAVLGEDGVVVVDYDETVARDGSVVPTLWQAAGLPTIPSQDSIFGRGWVNLTPISSEEPAPAIDEEGCESSPIQSSQAVQPLRRRSSLMRLLDRVRPAGNDH
jgi:hypothetical protein